MSTSRDALALFAVGSYSQALRILDGDASRRALSLDESVLRTQLLSLTGAVEATLVAARKLLKERGLSVVHRCKLRDALGSACFRKGDLSKASEHYLAGIQLAETDNQLVEECNLRVNFLRNQIHYVGPQQAAADLSELRRKIQHLGEQAVAVRFQLGLTELAAKLGLLPRARKHLETAKALLPTVQDKALHADCLLCEVALMAVESNLTDAIAQALQLTTIAEQTGSE